VVLAEPGVEGKKKTSSTGFTHPHTTHKATQLVLDSIFQMKKLNPLKLRPAKKLKYSFKTKPYSHQKKALNKILKLDGQAALFMEMGTGKTKVAIDWAGIGFYNFGIRRVLVVAPLSVLGVWPRQIRQHSNVPSRAFRLEGTTRERLANLSRILRNPEESKLTYVIINYEGIWRDGNNGGSVEASILKWNPDLVIFDESHRLKNPMSKQSRSAYRISKEISHSLILTGTPITKAPLDAFGQFRAVNDRIFGSGDQRSDWKHFREYFGIWGGWGKHQLKGYRHLDELIGKVRRWSYRVRKEQCFDLPPKLWVDVPVTLSDRAMKLYVKMANDMIVEIETGVISTAKIVLTKLLRLSQITSGFLKDEAGLIRVFDDSKLRACSDLLKDLVIEEGHQVVIFVRFIADIDRIREELIRLKIKHRILSGSVPGHLRDSLYEEFQSDPSIGVFVAQIQSGSEGIELYKADAAIYYSMNHSFINYSQSQDRLHRPGAEIHEKITYYRLVVPRSVDVLTYRALEEKRKIAKMILHDPQILRP
jgi:SNF2 family DNA or RNA helicase